MRFLNADYTDECAVTDLRLQRREESKALVVSTRVLKAQRWDCVIGLVGDASLRRDVLVHQKTQGLGLPFSIPMPQDMHSIGVANDLPTGTLNVRAAADSGAGSVSVSVAGGGKQVYKGMYVAFDNHKKVYMVVEDDAVYAGTPKALKLYPNLVSDVPITAKLVLEPNLWCVYNPGLSFGTHELTGGAIAHYALLSVTEQLEITG